MDTFNEKFQKIEELSHKLYTGNVKSAATPLRKALMDLRTLCQSERVRALQFQKEMKTVPRGKKAKVEDVVPDTETQVEVDEEEVVVPEVKAKKGRAKKV